MPLRHEPTEENLDGEHPVLIFKFWVGDIDQSPPDDDPDFDFGLNPDCGWASAVFTPDLAVEVGHLLLDWAAGEERV